MEYVYLSIDHESFITGKHAIVGISEEFKYITEYVEFAKEKVCEKLNLNKDEVSILDYKFLGNDLICVNPMRRIYFYDK